MKTFIEKGILAAAAAWIGNETGLIFPALVFLTLLMTADYISGMLASKKEAIDHPNNKEYGWSSKKSILGIYRKIGHVLIVLVGISVDYLIYKIIGELGVEIKTSTIFGLLVLAWLIINELLSILENAGRMGAKLPNFLKKVLSELRKDIE